MTLLFFWTNHSLKNGMVYLTYEKKKTLALIGRIREPVTVKTTKTTKRFSQTVFDKL